MVRLTADGTASSSPADGKEPRMKILIKAGLALGMLGFMAFPVLLFFFAWQRGLGSTH